MKRGRTMYIVGMGNYIIDIDGTLLEGNRELNHGSAFLKCLEGRGDRFLLATNSIKSPRMQARRFAEIGLSLEPDRFYSPVNCVNWYLGEMGYSRVLVVGSREERDQIGAEQSSDDPDLIILLDFEKEDVSYGELQRIADHMARGCPAVTASGSPYYFKSGKKQIDTGAFVRLLESVTERKIPVLGKPSPDYFRGARSLLCGPGEPVTVIGDDWQTDILGGREAGFSTVLVASGKYRPGDEEKGRPDLLVNDLLALCR